jgi:hypothetical protein
MSGFMTHKMVQQLEPRNRDHFESALQAGCQALVEVQMIRQLGSADPAIELHTGRALKSLRQVIDELRAAGGGNQSPLVRGFVAARCGDAIDGDASDDPRRSPR